MLKRSIHELGPVILAGLLLVLMVPVQAQPEIQHWTAPNGARVYFVPAHELPMVDVRLVFDAGSARDGDLPGLATLTNALLDSGTEEMSADQVAERLDAVGAQVGNGAAKDMASVTLRSLIDPAYLDPAVDVVARLLSKPAFAKADLERERARMLTGVAARKQSPGELAQVAFQEALYGDHPYATPSDGYEATLKAISQDDIRAFHQRYYVGANLVVAIVGDLDRSEAARLAEALTGALPTGEAAPALPPVEPPAQGQTIRIPHPSSQSHVLMGQVGIERGNPDYYALYLGNHVLGGSGLVSLLAEEVREKRGLSYSVYSYFSPMSAPGPFVMGLQTRADQAREATEVLRQTLAGFVAGGPQADALEAARQNIIGGFALRLDSNAKTVGYLAAIGFYELPLDYLETFPQRIEALSREQVTQALQAHLNQDRLLTVIVGEDGS